MRSTADPTCSSRTTPQRSTTRGARPGTSTCLWNGVGRTCCSPRGGSGAAYVLELRRQVYDVCRAALELPPWSWAATIEPLLDVRSHAVVRRGIPRMTLDWDGTLRLAPP